MSGYQTTKIQTIILTVVFCAIAGGMAELIQYIKKSHIPIICTCNDRSNPKIRSLANYCLDLRFRKPTTQVSTHSAYLEPATVTAIFCLTICTVANRSSNQANCRVRRIWRPNSCSWENYWYVNLSCLQLWQKKLMNPLLFDCFFLFQNRLMVTFDKHWICCKCFVTTKVNSLMTLSLNR